MVDATESRSIAKYKRLEFQGGERWKVHRVPGFTWRSRAETIREEAQVLLLVSKKVPKRVYLPLVFGNSDDLEYARCTHIHEGPRYQTTRKEVAKLSGDNFSCVVGLIRHPLGMHGGNGLGSDVYILKVVDDLRDELSRDVYREVWAGGASGHW